MPRKQPGVFKYQTKAGRVRWGYVIDLHADYEPGTRRQHKRRGFDTQTDAADALNKAKKAIETGSEYFDAERMTFIGYLHHWLDNLPGTGIKERTLSDYRNETRRYITPHMKDVPMQKLSPLHLEALYRTLTERGGMNDRPLGPHTVLRVHRVIRKALGDAERKGLIVSNPARLAQKPSLAQIDSEKPAWTPDELQTFLEAVKDHELFPVWRLAALTGMRRAELLGLKWEHVNDVAQTVRIIETLITVNGVPKTVPPKSLRSRRVIDIDDETAEVLREHRRAQNGLRQFVGSGWQENGYVFTTALGTPFHPDFISKAFTKLVRQLPVTYISLHGLRHTHATQLLATGTISPRVISERLGHANVAFTLQVYGHVLPGQQRAAADAAAGLLC